MLYKIQKSINGKEYPIVVGSDENQSAITADTMIKDSDVFGVLLNSASMKIAVFPNTSVPEIVLTEQSAKVMDITAVYNAIGKLKAASPNGEISQSYIQRLREALETKIPDKDQVYAILAITMTYVNNQGSDFTDPVNVALDNIYDECYDNRNELMMGLRMLQHDRSYVKLLYSAKCGKAMWLLPFHINNSIMEDPELVMVITKSGEFYHVKTIYGYTDYVKDKITALSLYSKVW